MMPVGRSLRMVAARAMSTKPPTPPPPPSPAEIAKAIQESEVTVKKIKEGTYKTGE